MVLQNGNRHKLLPHHAFVLGQDLSPHFGAISTDFSHSSADRLAGMPRRQARSIGLIANLTGWSRLALHRARDGQESAETAELLTPLIRQFEAGKLKFRRSGPRSRDREIIET
jgi:hypothetical protein